jgi:crossover junction endodeoxyribonuclease RuvC
MAVLGIDPGSRVTGYAVVSRKSGRYTLIEAGTIRTDTKKPIPERLAAIHSGLEAVIQRNEPSSAAIESIFRYKSSDSALKLGQARGVALLVAAQNGLAVSDYNPMTVKMNVGGHGRAGKEEVARMVARLLGLRKELPSDASDAAAIAITHIASAAMQSRVTKR